MQLVKVGQRVAAQQRADPSLTPAPRIVEEHEPPRRYAPVLVGESHRERLKRAHGGHRPPDERLELVLGEPPVRVRVVAPQVNPRLRQRDVTNHKLHERSPADATVRVAGEPREGLRGEVVRHARRAVGVRVRAFERLGEFVANEAQFLVRDPGLRLRGGGFRRRRRLMLRGSARDDVRDASPQVLELVIFQQPALLVLQRDAVRGGPQLRREEADVPLRGEEGRDARCCGRRGSLGGR